MQPDKSTVYQRMVCDAVMSLNEKELANMAGFVLAGWSMHPLQFTNGPNKWVGRRKNPDRQLFAPTLLSLIGYIDIEESYRGDPGLD